MDCGTPQVSSQRKVQYTHHFDHGRHFFDDLGAMKFTDSITNTIPNHTYPKNPFTACCLEQWSNEVELDDFTPGGNLIHVQHRLLIMRVLCHAGCQRKVNVRINYALASDDAWERWPGDIHGGSMTFV